MGASQQLGTEAENHSLHQKHATHIKAPLNKIKKPTKTKQKQTPKNSKNKTKKQKSVPPPKRKKKNKTKQKLEINKKHSM